jgi:hypothetical protein
MIRQLPRSRSLAATLAKSDQQGVPSHDSDRWSGGADRLCIVRSDQDETDQVAGYVILFGFAMLIAAFMPSWHLTLLPGYRTSIVIMPYLFDLRTNTAYHNVFTDHGGNLLWMS